MKSIQHQTASLPPTAPVMFLPTVMLPHVMLPLYIFEPRYRRMLAHCLEQNRMFCVALMRPGVSEVTSQEDYYHTAGLGLLRACVGHPDGTSHLVLQGLARVQLRNFVQDQPFRIAEVRELVSQPARGAGIDALSEQLRETCLEMAPAEDGTREKLEEQITQIDDPGMLCDIIAHTFLRNPFRQQELLEQLDVRKRMERLLEHLEAQREEG